jgi:hypothetical protein
LKPAGTFDSVTPATWISLAAFALALYVAIRQEVTRLRSRPKLIVTTSVLHMPDAADNRNVQKGVIVRVRALGGR